MDLGVQTCGRTELCGEHSHENQILRLHWDSVLVCVLHSGLMDVKAMEVFGLFVTDASCIRHLRASKSLCVSYWRSHSHTHQWTGYTGGMLLRFYKEPLTSTPAGHMKEPLTVLNYTFRILDDDPLFFQRIPSPLALEFCVPVS